MKKYVVVDTNVLVSALITGNEFSSTVKILKFIAEDKIIPVYSAEILEEYNQVLKREKFKLPDPNDIVFYAVTLSSNDKNTVLVTGNKKHFPIKPFVLSPAQLVEILE